jgi:sRNA-binding regulator protein Hfq
MKHIKSFLSLKNLFLKSESDDDIAQSILNRMKNEKFKVTKFMIPGSRMTSLDGFIKEVNIDDYVISIERRFIHTAHGTDISHILFIDNIKMNCNQRILNSIYLTLKNPDHLTTLIQYPSSEVSDEEIRYIKKDARIHFIK